MSQKQQQFIDAVLKKLGDELSVDQHQAIDDLAAKGVSVKDAVKIVKRMEFV